MKLQNAILAFSGGVDSVAVSQYMLRMGHKPPHVAIVSTELDYACHLEYINTYCEKYEIPLTVIDRIDMGVSFLKRNPQYIFPFESKIKGRWFKLFQQDGIRMHSQHVNADTVIFGRRRLDGNSIKDRQYRLKNGILQFFPIMDWDNDTTWSFVEGIELSPLYNHKRGRARGTHPINIANMYSDDGLNDALDFIKLMEPQKYELAIELISYKQMQNDPKEKTRPGQRL